MIKFNRIYFNPIYYIIFSIVLYIFQRQFNFYNYDIGNIKLFEIYNILIFVIFAPILLTKVENNFNKIVFYLSISIIFYSNFILFLKYSNILVSINSLNLFNYKLWNLFSIYNYLSFLCLGSLFLLLKLEDLNKFFKVIFAINIIIFFEVFLHILTISLNFQQSPWVSDFLSGNRFQTLLFNDSSETGMFLLVGYFFFVALLKKNKIDYFYIVITIFYAISITLTEERYVILSFLIFHLFATIKNSKNFFLGILMIIIIFAISYNIIKNNRVVFKDLDVIQESDEIKKVEIKKFENLDEIKKFENLDDIEEFEQSKINKLTDDGTYIKKSKAFSFKSVTHRLILIIRSVEIGKYFFPFGTGPGSYINYMYNDVIPLKIFYDFIDPTKINFLQKNNSSLLSYIEKKFYLSDILKTEIKHHLRKSGQLSSCKSDLYKNCSTIAGRSFKKISLHNVFAEQIISFGLLGIIVVILIVFTMIFKFYKFIFGKINTINTLKLAFPIFAIVFWFDSTYINYVLFFLVFSYSNFKIQKN